jgi:peroxin-10
MLLTAQRRTLGVLFLLGPSVLTLATSLGPDHGNTVWSRTRNRIARLMETPLGQSLPELHLITFLYRGKFLEIGRRLAGLRYVSVLIQSWLTCQISTAAPNLRRRSSYEPLAALLVIPLLFRLWKARQPSLDPANMIAEVQEPDSRPSTTASDAPNTYLTQEAADTSDRQCTLCLEPRGTGEGSGGTVAVTECGHVFCWGCLGGLDKVSQSTISPSYKTDGPQPECPLCRQSLRMERLIAAYNL